MVEITRAALIVVVHGDEGPVGDYARDVKRAVWGGTREKIFDGGGVGELDVGVAEDAGEEGGSEKEKSTEKHVRSTSILPRKTG